MRIWTQRHRAVLASTVRRHLPTRPQNRVTGEFQSRPIVMPAIKKDKEWQSDHDCFVRRNLEVFTAAEKDVLTARADRKLGDAVGQVGIRCLHCAVAVSCYMYCNGRRGVRDTAVVYPHSMSNIFECVKELHRNRIISRTVAPIFQRM